MSLKNIRNFSLAEGDLKETPFAALLGLAKFAGATGTLSIRREKIAKVIYIYNGIPIYCASEVPAESLRQYLARSGKISKNNVVELEKAMEADAIDEGAALLRLGIINESTRHREMRSLTTRRILTVFEWNSGKYSFDPGEEFMREVDIFDVDPLDIIHEGISTYQGLKIADEIQEISNLEIEAKGDWDELEGFFVRYHPDADRGALSVGRLKTFAVIPKITKDVNRSLALIYELIVTGYLALEGHLPGDESPITTKKSYAPKSSFDVTPPPRRPAERTPAPSGPPEPPASFRKKTLKSYEEIERERQNMGSQPVRSRTPTPAQAQMDVDLLRRFEAMLSIIRKGDLFETLGVTIETDRAEIKKAYFSKNQNFHRDRARPLGHSGEVLADQIHEGLEKAYETLSDPDKRYAHETASLNNEQHQGSSVDYKRELAHIQARRASWYMTHKRPQLAYDFYDAANKLDAENAHYYAYLGWSQYLAEKAKAPEARAFLKAALEIDPKLTEAYLFLGWIEKDMGNYSAAASNFEKSYQADQRNRWAKAELERLKTERPKTEGILGKLFKK